MATQYKIETDAENEKIVIRRVDDTTGSDLADYPKITIALGDLEALSGAASVEIKVREFHWLDKDACTEKKAYFLMSDPEDV